MADTMYAESLFKRPLGFRGPLGSWGQDGIAGMMSLEHNFTEQSALDYVYLNHNEL